MSFCRNVMRVWGPEPEKVLTREALAEPHRIYATTEDTGEAQIGILGQALKDFIKRELLDGPDFSNP